MEEHRQVAPSLLSPPGPCPPEGLSGGCGLPLPPQEASLCPSPLGPNPRPAPNYPTSQKDQVLSLRGAGGGGEGF